MKKTNFNGKKILILEDKRKTCFDGKEIIELNLTNKEVYIINENKYSINIVYDLDQDVESENIFKNMIKYKLL